MEYVYSDTGLYPLPIARNCKSSHKSKIKNKFQFLGKFMAKAVLDNRYRKLYDMIIVNHAILG